MKKTASLVAEASAWEEELPVRVQEALGELAAAAREGLLALSVGVGLGVLAELMEEEVVGVVGAKGKHDRERVAVRHGHEVGAVTLGGRRVAVERPRVRSADGMSERPLTTYRHFSDRDPLTRVVMERMLAGVSTRRYRRTQEPVGEEVEGRVRSTSKSSVSRAFVQRTSKALQELMARRLDDVRLAVLMLDGIELKGRTNIVALGITTEGLKVPLGLWDGSTENATVATALLSDLVERGLDPEQGMLFVIDGSKALRRAIRDVFGEAPVQRVSGTRSETSWSTCPSVTGPPSSSGCAKHGRSPITTGRSIGCTLWLSSWSAATPARQAHCGRARRDARADAARRRWLVEAHARLNEPVRVDDRVRPPHEPQRQKLVVRGDGAALDCRRDARSRAAVPQDHRLPRPRQARPRNRTRPRSHDCPVPDRGGRRGPEAGTGGSFRPGDVRGDRGGLRNASAGRGRGCRGWGCGLASCRAGLRELWA